MTETDEPVLSVKQRLQQFEQQQQQQPKPTTKPFIPAKPSVSPLSTRLADKDNNNNEFLGDSPTSSAASENLLRPLKPSPSPSASPQPSRPNTPSTSSTTSTSTSHAPLRSKASSNSLPAPPPALPPRKPVVVKATSVPGPSLPPRKPPLNHVTEGNLKRRPVDPRARSRFESLFDAQLQVAPQSWTEENKLPGKLVCALWTRSGVSKGALKDIWNECDVNKQGMLDREAFVKGMWAVDEHTRRKAS